MEVDVEKFTTVPLFEGLQPNEIMDLLKIAENVSTDAGEEVCTEGSTGDGFYVIGAGAFEVVKAGAKLARLEERSYFGEMSLVREAPRSASVVCVEEGRLKKFPAQDFRVLVEKGNPTAQKVVWNMCRILAERLARVEDKLIG